MIPDENIEKSVNKNAGDSFGWVLQKLLWEICAEYFKVTYR